ncbi:hypothetical protein CPT_Moabite_013 [Serratia phage Moabite]|uniref:Uncharacterized protein n=1 Tax=Serratia phage Moabite TaxID=2587814 RepID=A0A4Y5TNV1_9CAUD|nr:hypothetical protein HWC48_gp013 [Serratia phage Moabite]QDB71045.1 hypothetical protein CPT_Moabite_013 [Serratia phage Moabite]
MSKNEEHHNAEARLTVQSFFEALGLRTQPKLPEGIIGYNGQVNISLLRGIINAHPLRQLIQVSKAKSDFTSLPMAVQDIVKALSRYEDSEWVLTKFGVFKFKLKKPKEEIQTVIEKYRNEIPNHVYDKLKNALKSW